MGKSRQKKRKAKELAARKKRIQPDDYYHSGSLEMARFGKHVVMRSDMQPDEFEEWQTKLVEHFPEVCKEIDDIIAQIVGIVSKLPPGEILKRAYWEMAAHHLHMDSESYADSDDIISLRMVDYLQSIIASATPADVVEDEITEDNWLELRKLVGELFQKLSLEYQICRTAYNRRNNPDFDLEYEEYYYKAQQYWSNVRGHRYLVHEIPALREILKPHSEILEELFGIDADKLIDNIKRIQDSLTFGIGKVMKDLRELQEVTTEKALKKIKEAGKAMSTDISELISRVIEENKLQDFREDIRGRFLGLDLFDLEKITDLPKSLLDELSWEPGQDKEFLEEGDYKGWPLRIWPIFKRPFLKLDGRYYCFELYSLFDHLYRVIQHIIIRTKPEYTEEWNKKQKNTSEHLPFDLFNILLPNARVYRPVYYRWYVGDKEKNKQWCEADGLLIYEDHLFIIEIRAGAFTYTPPATDFPAYITSIKNLLFKPAEQGKRFLEYLNSEKDVTIFDESHSEIGKISKSNFEHITICTITLDHFTELAAQAQHLKKIGIDIGENPVWAISIDNLREYSDVFDNPLIFLHFVEERMRAFQSDIIQVEDELDHLGLYLKHNVYTKYAQKMIDDGKTKLTWYGYRSDIDKFFAEKIRNQNVECLLKQDMPKRLKSIIDFLSTSTIPNRRKVASMLLACGGEARESIVSNIDDVLIQQSKTKRPLPLSTYGEIKITVFCWQVGSLDRNYELAQIHTKAAMMVASDDERLLIELIYDEHGVLVDVYPDFITLKGMSSEELENIKVEAEQLRKSRIKKAMSLRGKIGRNELCPCGSGKKYKNCCLNTN